MVSAFREHFLDKYFAYRRRYVDHIVREAPRRAPLAVVSEIARLGFQAIGCGLCAMIFWLLTVGAVGRAGGVGVWPVVFAFCALVPTAFLFLSLAGIAAALRDRGRVKEQSGG